MTGTLAVLSQALHRLVDETNVLLVDVEAQQAQSSGGTAANTVQELQCLAHQVVVVLVILVSQKVLKFKMKQSFATTYEAKVDSQSTHFGFSFGNVKDIFLLWVKFKKLKTVVRFSLLLLFHIQSSHTITPCLWKKQKHFVILIICAAWREVNQYLLCTLGQNGGHRVIQHTAKFHLMETCTGLGHTLNQCKRKHFSLG